MPALSLSGGVEFICLVLYIYICISLYNIHEVWHFRFRLRDFHSAFLEYNLSLHVLLLGPLFFTLHLFFAFYKMFFCYSPLLYYDAMCKYKSSSLLGGGLPLLEVVPWKSS